MAIPWSPVILLNIKPLLKFSLLSLLAPIPSTVNGYFGLSGKYSLTNGTPQVTSDLIIKDTKIDDRKIILDKGTIFYKDNL